MKDLEWWQAELKYCPFCGFQLYTPLGMPKVKACYNDGHIYRIDELETGVVKLTLDPEGDVTRCP